MSETERQEHDLSHDAVPAPAQAEPGGFTQAVVQMIRAGARSPADVARFLQTHPAARHEVIAMLHSAMGNSFVQSVLALVGATPAATHGAANAEAAAAPTAHATTPAPTVAPAPAPAAGRVRVTSHGLHVRKSPARSPDNIIGLLERHQIVAALGRDGAWMRISHGDQPAFVFAEFVEPVQNETEVAAAPTPHAPSVATPAAPKPEHVEAAQPHASVPATPAPTPAHVAPAPAPVAPAPATPAPIAAPPAPAQCRSGANTDGTDCSAARACRSIAGTGDAGTDCSAAGTCRSSASSDDTGTDCSAACAGTCRSGASSDDAGPRCSATCAGTCRSSAGTDSNARFNARCSGASSEAARSTHQRRGSSRGSRHARAGNRAGSDGGEADGAGANAGARARRAAHDHRRQRRQRAESARLRLAGQAHRNAGRLHVLARLRRRLRHRSGAEGQRSRRRDLRRRHCRAGDDARARQEHDHGPAAGSDRPTAVGEAPEGSH